MILWPESLPGASSRVVASQRKHYGIQLIFALAAGSVINAIVVITDWLSATSRSNATNITPLGR